ncbi:YciI family protein [Arthrobacter sp. 35W]|uniref:YciI family protein n=1 Tax=Arthrobacter sp. 35W TaxID=1132441 RepID=UPI0004287B7F|nr:YciI family protein [Arthrobacter sp. 35W]
MTQYLISVGHDTDDAPTMATMDPAVIQPIIDAVDAFNDKLRAEGAWVFAGGLEPIQSATTVDNTGEEPAVTAGPHVLPKEYLGGFWVIEAAGIDAALEWAKQASKACAGRVEVRAFQEVPA